MPKEEVSRLRARPKGCPIALWKPSGPSPCCYPFNAAQYYTNLFLNHLFGMRQKDFASAEASRGLCGHRRSAFDFRLRRTRHWRAVALCTPSHPYRLLRKETCNNIASCIDPALHPAGGRRFPKGDRKALWSRPQARNPSAGAIAPRQRTVGKPQSQPCGA